MKGNAKTDKDAPRKENQGDLTRSTTETLAANSPEQSRAQYHHVVHFFVSLLFIFRISLVTYRQGCVSNVVLVPAVCNVRVRVTFLFFFHQLVYSYLMSSNGSSGIISYC